MAALITMTPQDMRDNAKLIDGHRDQITQILVALDRVISDVEAGWKGASQCSFLASYQEMKTTALDHFPEILQGISTQLTSSAQIMEETDEKLAQMLNGQGG